MINTASQTESATASISGQQSTTGPNGGQPLPTQSPAVVTGTPGKKKQIHN